MCNMGVGGTDLWSSDLGGRATNFGRQPTPFGLEAAWWVPRSMQACMPHLLAFRLPCGPMNPRARA